MTRTQPLLPICLQIIRDGYFLDVEIDEQGIIEVRMPDEIDLS